MRTQRAGRSGCPPITHGGHVSDTAPKSGPGKGLVILVIAAIAAVGTLGYKLYEKRQALDETVVEAPAADTPAEQKSDLPLFAPRPEESTDQAAQPDSTALADVGEEMPAPTGSVTMRAADPASDRVLTRAFVRDLAAFLARAYHPAGTRDNLSNRGVTTMTFKRLNMRYGVDLTGLDVDAKDSAIGRDQALSHLMSPIVLRLAFDILADPFVEELAAQAANQSREFTNGSGYAARTLRDGHVREMLKLHAALVNDAGKIFRTYASRPNLVSAMRRYFQAVEAVNAAYGKYADREAVSAPQAELDAISVEIQNAIKTRDTMRANLMKGAAPGSGSMLTDGDALDIAAWIYRRLKHDPESINAIGALASLSTELSQKLNDYVYPAAQ